MRHTYNKNINEYVHYEVKEDDTLLNFLLNNVKESRSKIKATLQGKGIKVDVSKTKGNNQKRRLRDFEIDKIVNTFQNKEAVDDFFVAVTYDEIKEKGYSLSAGQYFDIKIDYVDITEEEFNKRMDNYKSTLKAQFEESHRLEAEILKQLDCISFDANVGKATAHE